MNEQRTIANSSFQQTCRQGCAIVNRLDGTSFLYSPYWQSKHDLLSSIDDFRGFRIKTLDQGRSGSMPPIILVVDSDPSNCAEWESLLQSQGCDVIAARTGETALALCPKVQPDLVLLRDLLPDIQGLEVCRRLKADLRNRLTPIIMLASTDSASLSSSAHEAGADDFWGHPPTPWEAIGRVQSLLQLKASYR